MNTMIMLDIDDQIFIYEGFVQRFCSMLRTDEGGMELSLLVSGRR